MVSIVVPDQQEALEWYQRVFDLEVRDDQPMPDDAGRWLTIGVPGQDDVSIVLEPLEWGHSGEREGKEDVIGRNGLSFTTEDCEGTVARLQRSGAHVVSGPEEAPWGTFALVEDLYGNVHHVIQPNLRPGA